MEKHNKKLRVFRKKSSNKDLVTKQIVKSMINNALHNEVRYVDFTGNVSGTVGGIQAFTLPTVGTAVDERLGDAIRLTHIDMRISYDQTETTQFSSITGSATFIRLSIIQIIGEEVPTADDIYDNSATVAGIVVSPFSYANEGKLFHVVHDEVYHLDSFNRGVFSAKQLRPRITRLRYDTNNNQWSTGQPYIVTTYFSDGASPNIRQVSQFRVWYYTM